MYECIHDPSRMFRGSCFWSGDFDQTLEAGNLSPGSIWRDNSTGREYRIVGNEAYHLMHECLHDVSNIPEDIQEGQRLVEVR